MNIMIAFGIASIMLLLGMFLRAKVRFLQNLLLPFLDHCRNSGTAPVKCSGGFFYPSWSGDKRFFFDCKSVICYRIYFHYIDGAFGGGQPRRNEEYAERRFGDRPDLVSVIYADTADFCNTVPFIRKEFSF